MPGPFIADEFAARLRAMSDAEMLELGVRYGQLVEEAQSLVRMEFARRSLETPVEHESSTLDPLAQVTTIRQFRDQSTALLARSVLESAGIACFLRDENTIRMDWLWSNLMGGIRLQVGDRDVEAAEAILSQPIPESIPFAGGMDYEQPQCPKCGSLDVSFNNFDAKVGATSILLLGFPLPSPVEKAYWHCNQCDSNWTDRYAELYS